MAIVCKPPSVSSFNYTKSNFTQIILHVLIIWLYKDSKYNLHKNYNSKISYIEQQLKEYYKLEGFISYFINEKFNNQSNIKLEIYKKLGDSNLYFSEDLRKAVIDFYRVSDDSKLVLIKNLIQAKIANLREEKRNLISKNNSEEIDVYIINLLKPLKPIITIFFILFVSFLFYLIEKSQYSALTKSAYFSLIFGFLISMLMFHVLIKYNNYKEWKNLKLIIIVLFIPIIFIFLNIRINSYWLIILIPFLQILILTYEIKYKSNKKNITTKI